MTKITVRGGGVIRKVVGLSGSTEKQEQENPTTRKPNVERDAHFQTSKRPNIVHGFMKKVPLMQKMLKYMIQITDTFTNKDYK